MKPKNITRLREINASMEEAVHSFDVITFSRLNRQFHYEIYRSCANNYMIERLKDTWERLDAIRVTVYTYIPQRSRTAIVEHEEIIQAIEQQASFGKIEHLARKHKLLTMQAYIAHTASS